MEGIIGEGERGMLRKIVVCYIILKWYRSPCKIGADGDSCWKNEPLISMRLIRERFVPLHFQSLQGLEGPLMKNSIAVGGAK